jgi:2-aminoadipate transaminase
MVASTGLALDPSANEPLYKQIFEQIAARIRSNAFPAGFRLAPTRDLARELSTHRNTVVRAYVDLEHAGFVTSVVGRGTFVAPQRSPAPARAPAASGAMPWSSLLARTAVAEPLGRFGRLAARPSDKTAVNLTRMQPSADLLPHELLRRCIDHVLRTKGADTLSYAPADGLPRLRGLIAEDLARQGVPATAEDIVVTTGSQQALDLIARALVNPGDPFLVDPTTYIGALNLLTLAGARVLPIASDDEGPDLAALERHARSGVKGIYLMPNAHNPTTATTSAERRAALVAWSRQNSVPLIEDDYGADLSLDGDPSPPPMRALDGDVIYIGTFSKRLIPALRVGFIVCPKALKPTLVAIKHAMDLGTSVLLQYALAEFLERGYLRAHLNRTLPEYRARRDALERGLTAHLPRGMSWRSPSRGLVLWLPLSDRYQPEDVFEEARRRGVLVSPSTLQAVDDRSERGLRLTFCAEPSDRLILGARRLGEALRAAAEPLRHEPKARETARLEAV